MELTIAQAVKQIGISKSAVIAALRRGSLHGRKVADRWWVIDSDSLTQFRKSNRGRPKTTGNGQAEYQLRLRLEVIAKLGGKCVSCGFSDWRALQIDHKNAKGWAKKNGHVRLGTGVRYRLVLAAPSGQFQLLCSNCNWIKRFENNEHSKTTTAEALIAKFTGLVVDRVRMSE